MSKVLSHRWFGLTVIVMLIVSVPSVAFWVGQNSYVGAEEPAIEQARDLSRAFRLAAKKVLPTVVKIATKAPLRTRGGPAMSENPFEGTPFEEFFKDHEFRGLPTPQLPRRSGIGSGVIIDSKGVVLTNNHVVEGADEVVVELADGRRFEAADIKVDQRTDLAVIRIQADEPLPAARLGDSDQLEIGEWVLAVGSPFELANTVSAGIISAKGRPLGLKRTRYLQTDAAINPGNSGGPLVTLDGSVVGINTAIASNNGGYQGIGFAIPSNLAKWVTGQLVEHGAVRRAYLGVGIGKLQPEVADQLGVATSEGVLVSEVYENTPAAKAGIQVGDVIVSFSGQPVRTPRDLQEVVERSKFGSRQTVHILRGDQRKELQVVIESLPEDFGMVASRSQSRGGGRPFTPHQDKQLGIAVADITKEIARQLGHEGSDGVIITEVEPGSIASEAGLREGMLVLRVGKEPVKNLAEYEAAMKKQSLEEGVLLLLRTRGGNRFVVLKE